MKLPRIALPFDAAFALPGSKSHAQRALVAAALARGRTVLLGATPGDDVVATAGGIARLGAGVRWVDRAAGMLELDGGALGGGGRIDCGASGTALRLLTALAATAPGEWELTGDARLCERPIGPLVAALRALGARIDGDRAPLRVDGGTLHGGAVTLDASASSQFASALLLVAPAIGGLELTLRGEPVSRGYVALTAGVMRAFGVTATRHGDAWRVPAGAYRSPGDLPIEGDWSAAGTLLVLAELTGSRFRGTNLAPDSAQPDRAIGDAIAALRGAGDGELDLREMPDQALALAVLAACRDGVTRLTGLAHLRGKESDRLARVAEQLARAGAWIEASADGWRIEGPTQWRAARLCCAGDHRLAFAHALVASRCDGIELDDPACVAKSWPGFWQDLARLQRSPRAIVLLGMRGAGKSKFARRLALRLQRPFADSDREFEREHGPIAAFVAAHGWPAFRAREAEIAARIVQPGVVVALGGGAIETPAIRALLAERAFRIWLRPERDLLLRRLRRTPRPPLTDLPLEREVDELLARREPLWRAECDEVVAGYGEFLRRHGLEDR